MRNHYGLPFAVSPSFLTILAEEKRRPQRGCGPALTDHEWVVRIRARRLACWMKDWPFTDQARTYIDFVVHFGYGSAWQEMGAF
jgi:hypothetical protein